ncbi:MAG: hypothetical protein HOY71_51230 [Nonomuraea sp.]|nr:hypothetical protein [Nonomuraea sp.]
MTVTPWWRGRITALIGLGTLVPVTVLAWFLLFVTWSYSRCLAYGEGCNPASDTLMTVAWWAFWGSAAAGVAALVVRRAATRTRLAFVTVQLGLELTTFVSVIASG